MIDRVSETARMRVDGRRDQTLALAPARVIVATTLAIASMTARIVARSFPPTMPVELKTGNNGRTTE